MPRRVLAKEAARERWQARAERSSGVRRRACELLAQRAERQRLARLATLWTGREWRHAQVVRTRRGDD